MAKLTDRQRNNILAKWNTGEYTKTALAKAYKVTEKVVREIVGKEEPKNSHLVEAGVLFEKAKKSEKSPSEIAAIEQAIKHRLEKEYNDDNNRLKVYDITGDILDGVKSLIKGGKAQKPTTATVGEGIVESNIVEYDLQAEHYEKAMNTVDKASIVLKVSDRHAPKSSLEVTQNHTEVTVEIT